MNWHLCAHLTADRLSRWYSWFTVVFVIEIWVFRLSGFVCIWMHLCLNEAVVVFSHDIRALWVHTTVHSYLFQTMKAIVNVAEVVGRLCTLSRYRTANFGWKGKAKAKTFFGRANLSCSIQLQFLLHQFKRRNPCCFETVACVCLCLYSNDNHAVGRKAASSWAALHVSAPGSPGGVWFKQRHGPENGVELLLLLRVLRKEMENGLYEKC